MKQEKLLHAIGGISEDFIEEAAACKREAKSPAWVTWAAIAACLALALYAGVRYMPPGRSDPGVSAPPQELPMLTIQFPAGGMGFEGCLAYDISELEDGNPWTEEARLDTLPVFQNSAYSDPAGTPVSDIGTERMEALARQAAHALDMEITGFSYERFGDTTKGSGMESDTVCRVTATTDAAKITVHANCSVTVVFHEGADVPGYSFTHSDTSDEAAADTIDYLAERFSALLSFAEPRSASFADYTFDGSRNRSYFAYDAAGDMTDQILSYHFRRVQFAPDSDGKLSLIRMGNQLSCAEKLGDYPLCTPEEARRLLLDGHYLTSVPEEMPGGEYVRKVELAYRTGNVEQTFLPYYRFWVELPDMLQENGLKTFGAYYVPAVRQEYIVNMPLWNGGFN